MIFLKQSTAITRKLGPFLDEADGKTAETGLTISQADIRLSKNGGAFAQTNNAAGATHDENGWYGVPLNTTDTATLGTLTVAIHESGALPVWETFSVLPANVWDSWFSTDKQQVDVTQWLGQACAAVTVNGVPEVDLTYIHGTALTETSGQLAASFKKFFDVGTPSGTVNSIPDAVAGAAGGLFIAGTNAETTISTALNSNIIGNLTGNLSGSVGSVTGSVASVSGAVGSVTGAVGSVAGAVGSVAGNVDGSVASVVGAVGSVTGAVGSVGAGGIASATFASAAITASAIATDAFGALELAAGAAAEIADAVWDELSTGHTDAGKAGAQLWTDIDAILTDTNELQADWADGGRLDLILDDILADTAAMTGPGAVTDTFTVNYSGSPVEGAEIWVTASSSTTPVIEGTYTTDALGQATFHLDVADGYYVHVQKSGYTFTDYPKEFNVGGGGFAWA